MPALALAATMQAIADALVGAGVVQVAYPRPTLAADTGEAVVRYPDTIDFGTTFARSLDTTVIPVIILAGLADDESGETQAALDRLVGAGSEAVVDALEGDLGGVVQACHVTRAAIARVLTEGGIEHMAVRFDLAISS